jgi:hypothetical protein
MNELINLFTYFLFHWLYSPLGPWPLLFFFQFHDHFTDGRTSWTRDQHVASPLPKHRTTQTQIKHIHTPNIHALRGIRTHDPSFRASEDSSWLRPLGYCDRHSPIKRPETGRSRRQDFIHAVRSRLLLAAALAYIKTLKMNAACASKRRGISELVGFTSRKTALSIVTAVGTPNLRRHLNAESFRIYNSKRKRFSVCFYARDILIMNSGPSVSNYLDVVSTIERNLSSRPSALRSVCVLSAIEIKSYFWNTVTEENNFTKISSGEGTKKSAASLQFLIWNVCKQEITITNRRKRYVEQVRVRKSLLLEYASL